MKLLLIFFLGWRYRTRLSRQSQRLWFLHLLEKRKSGKNILVIKATGAGVGSVT